MQRRWNSIRHFAAAPVDDRSGSVHPIKERFYEARATRSRSKKKQESLARRMNGEEGKAERQSGKTGLAKKRVVRITRVLVNGGRSRERMPRPSVIVLMQVHMSPGKHDPHINRHTILVAAAATHTARSHPSFALSVPSFRPFLLFFNPSYPSLCHFLFFYSYIRPIRRLADSRRALFISSAPLH
jgi:hypothetical protein